MNAVSSSSTLAWKVLVKRRASATRDLPAGNEALAWVANSVTLICAERDACLVDTFLTIEQAHELVEWVTSVQKNLATIYITHAHADHFFGLAALLERFPKARAVATPTVVRIMREQIKQDSFRSSWESRFPGQIPDKFVVAEPLGSNEFELEGHKLAVIEVGHTDTDGTTCLHVPSLDLVVAGDAVYNHIHPYLAESTPQTRIEWLAALDTIEALKPLSVVAGHKIPEADDSPRHIAETRKYLHDFIRLNDTSKSARQLYDAMLERYPDWVNPGSLWASANRAKLKG